MVILTSKRVKLTCWFCFRETRFQVMNANEVLCIACMQLSSYSFTYLSVSIQLFEGRNEASINFLPSIYTRYFRLYAKNWTRTLCTQMELYGCKGNYTQSILYLRNIKPSSYTVNYINTSANQKNCMETRYPQTEVFSHHSKSQSMHKEYKERHFLWQNH